MNLVLVAGGIIFLIIVLIIAVAIYRGKIKLPSFLSSSKKEDTTALSQENTFIFGVLRLSSGSKNVAYRSLKPNSPWNYLTTNGGILDVKKFSNGQLYFIPDSSLSLSFNQALMNLPTTPNTSRYFYQLTTGLSPGIPPNNIIDLNTATSINAINIPDLSITPPLNSIIQCRTQPNYSYMVLSSTGALYGTSANINTLSSPNTLSNFSPVILSTNSGTTPLFSKIVEYKLPENTTEINGFLVIDSNSRRLYTLISWNSTPQMDTAPTSLTLNDVTVLSDNKTIIGLTTSGVLYTRSSITEDWKLLDTSAYPVGGTVLSITS
jgi:hypothetical protein